MTQRIEFVIGTAKLYALVETFTADGEREGCVLSIHSRGSGNELPLKLLTREREVDLISEAVALEDQNAVSFESPCPFSYPVGMNVSLPCKLELGHEHAHLCGTFRVARTK